MNTTDPTDKLPARHEDLAFAFGKAGEDDWTELMPGADSLILLDGVTRHLGAALALVNLRGQWIFASEPFCRILDACSPDLRRALAEQAAECLRTPKLAARTNPAIPSNPELQAFHFHRLIHPQTTLTETYGTEATDTPPDLNNPSCLCLLTSTLPRLQHDPSRTSRTLIENLQRQAMTDPLTGLFNRRYLDHEAPRLLASAREGHKPLSVILLDLDHFKQINDTHGHQTGDQVLRIAASRIKAAIRPQDRACRYGGEEFLVLLPDTPVDVAVTIAERIRVRLSDPVGSLPAVAMSTSAGVSVCGKDEALVDAALARADQALYAAKDAGRNCVRTLI